MNIKNAIKNNKMLFAVILIYIFLVAVMPEKAVESSKNSMYYVKEMLQIMPVIFILTSLIEAWVPKEAILKGFGEDSGIKGPIFSFALGSLSAGPIYAAFPICKILLKKGASVSNIVIIISAWAVVKVPMLANEAKFLGPRFMATRWVLTTISIFAMAYIISRVVEKSSIPMEDTEDKEITSNIRNTLSIKEKYCIGCGICVDLSPDYFILQEGKARVAKEHIEEDIMENIQNIKSKCPVNAIQIK